MGLDTLGPPCTLARLMVIKGIPDSPMCRPMPPLQATLWCDPITIDTENRPLRAAPPIREIEKRTAPAHGPKVQVRAAHRRAVTAWIEREGAAEGPGIRCALFIRSTRLQHG